MKKVLLDSCVFFDMVYINNVYTNMGTDGVKKYIDKKTIQAQSIVSEIERYYPDNFKKMYKGEDRLFAAMNFKDYLYKKSNEYKETISILKNRLYTTTNFSERKEINKQINELVTKKDTINNIKYTLKNRGLFEDLKNCFNRLGPALLFERFLNKEISFFVPYVGYKEILTHIDDGTKKIYDDFLILPKKDIDSLLKNCTIISFVTPDAITTLKDIARKFRTLDEKEINAMPMARDKNSNCEYGDSKIAAVGAIAGIPLVTENGKDFIYTDNHDKTETKRNHIKNVCKENEPITTDAYPYTLLEYLCGKCKEPTITASLSSRVRHKDGVNNEIAF